MIDDFFDWFCDRLKDFGVFLIEAIVKALEGFTYLLAVIIVIVVIVALFPIWILPFIYWFVFVRNKEA